MYTTILLLIVATNESSGIKATTQLPFYLKICYFLVFFYSRQPSWVKAIPIKTDLDKLLAKLEVLKLFKQYFGKIIGIQRKFFPIIPFAKLRST